MPSISNETSSKSRDMNIYNYQYDKYDKHVNLNSDSLQNQVIETNNILNREYSLLVVWVIITIMIIIITTIGIVSNEMNSYILYIALGFLIFITFYIFKNIYIYFNGLK